MQQTTLPLRHTANSLLHCILLTGLTSGLQGQGRQTLGHNSHGVKIVDKFNLFAHVPQQQQDYLCLGLFAEGPAGSSSVLLLVQEHKVETNG